LSRGFEPRVGGRRQFSEPLRAVFWLSTPKNRERNLSQRARLGSGAENFQFFKKIFQFLAFWELGATRKRLPNQSRKASSGSWERSRSPPLVFSNIEPRQSVETISTRFSGKKTYSYRSSIRRNFSRRSYLHVSSYSARNFTFPNQ